METCRLLHTCSAMTSTSVKKRGSTWILTFLIIILHAFSMLSRTWYMIYIDLDGCYSCGSFIVSMATVFENSVYYDVYADDGDTLWNQHISSKIAHVDFRNSLRERQDDEFVIETGVYVYMGFWTASVCLLDGSTCVSMDHSTSSVMLRNTQPFGDMLESAYDSRLFLLLAIASHVFMVYMVFNSRLRPAIPTASDVKTTAGLEAVSAVFSLIDVVIAGMPYLTSMGVLRYVTPLFPWALLSTSLASFLSFVVAYTTWNRQTVRKMTSFRSWQAHTLYKYYI